MSLASEIESLLFTASRPLTTKKIGEIVDQDKKEIEEALQVLMEKYDQKNQGIKLMRQGNRFELVSDPANAKVVRKFLKDELTGELTRPSLETLSIISYRGQITKSELELIRGVNCSLILRNLLIRGLIEAEENKNDGLTYYRITFDFMRYLGISDVAELPDYEKLNRDKNLEDLLRQEEERSKSNE